MLTAKMIGRRNGQRCKIDPNCNLDRPNFKHITCWPRLPSTFAKDVQVSVVELLVICSPDLTHVAKNALKANSKLMEAVSLDSTNETKRAAVGDVCPTEAGLFAQEKDRIAREVERLSNLCPL